MQLIFRSHLSVLGALLLLCLACGGARAAAVLDNFETGTLLGATARVPWKTGAPKAWTSVADLPHAGAYCAQAGAVGHGETSTLEVRYTLPTPARLTFWYRTSCERGRDELVYTVDGVEQFTTSGELPWMQYTRSPLLPAGAHTFRWALRRDKAGDFGANLIWLDDLELETVNELKVTAPVGGEVWFSNERHLIRWESAGEVGTTVELQYSVDGQASWGSIARGIRNVPGENSYSWEFPPDAVPLTAHCFFRIVSENARVLGTSPAPIYLWPLQEDFEAGSLQGWPWRTSWAQPWEVVAQEAHHGKFCARRAALNADATLSLTVHIRTAGLLGFYFKKSSEADWFRFRIDGQERFATKTSRPWSAVTIPITPGVHTLTWEYDDESWDTSSLWLDAISFPMQTGITVCEPNGQDPGGLGGVQALLTGESADLWWKSMGAQGETVSLDYSTDDGRTWQSIAAAVPNLPGDNHYRWKVPVANATTCRVRVTPTAAPAAAGVSPGAFTIMEVEESFEAGDLRAWPWRTTWGRPWTVVTEAPLHGRSCARQMGLQADSALGMTLTVREAGFVGFYFRKSAKDDRFVVKIDGKERFVATQPYPWTCITLPLEAGTHTLEWLYVDTGWDNTGLWLDAIHLPRQTGIQLCEPSGRDPRGYDPQARQAVLAGEPLRLWWKSAGTVGDTVTLDYSLDDGQSWRTISEAPNVPGDNVFFWTTPPANTLTARIRVTPAQTPALSAVSPAFVLMEVTEDFESGELTSWPWRTGGGKAWEVVSDLAVHGIASVRGAARATSAPLTLTLTVKEPGFVGFFFQKDSADDRFRFSIDGTEQYSTAAPHPWTCITAPITPGVHTLTWDYVDTDWGHTTLWLDAVHFPVGTGILVSEPSGVHPLNVEAGQAWIAGEPVTCVWRSTREAGPVVALQFSADDKASWHTIAKDLPNTGPAEKPRTYGWTAPAVAATQCWVRVVSPENPTLSGESPRPVAVWGEDEGFEGDFTRWPWAVGAGWNIAPGGYRGKSAAKYAAGADAALEMKLTVTEPGFVGFFYKKDGDADALRFRIDGAQMALWRKSTAWTPAWFPLKAGTHVLRWEYANTDRDGAVVSLDAIGLPPVLGWKLATTSPWPSGSQQTLTWTSSRAVGDTVALDYSADGGKSWQSIIEAAPNTGLYRWAVPLIAARALQVRVRGARAGLAQAGVLLKNTRLLWMGPNGGETLTIGSTIPLTWESLLDGVTHVRLEWSADDGATWATLGAQAPNSGTFAWTVPERATHTARFRVTALGGDGTLTDTSDAPCRVTGVGRPDLLVRTADEREFTGMGLAQAEAPRTTLTVPPASPALFFVKVLHAGAGVDTLTLRAAGGAPGWQVRLFDAVTGGNDITAAMLGEGWTLARLAPGAGQDLRLECTPAATLPGGASLEVRLTAHSATDAQVADTHLLVAQQAIIHRPDLLARATADGAVIGDGQHSGSGDEQRVTREIGPGTTATYWLKVRNAGNSVEAFTVTGTPGGEGWTVRYFDAPQSGRDITAAMTGAGWALTGLDAGAARDLRVEVTPEKSVAGGAVRELLVTALPTQATAPLDCLKLVTTRRALIRADLALGLVGDAALLGGGRIGEAGPEQTRALFLTPGVVSLAQLELRNAGETPERFTLLLPPAPRGWNVRAFTAAKGGVEITEALTGAGWVSESLAPGARRTLHLQVTPLSTLAPGAQARLTFTATAQSAPEGPEARDQVALALTRWERGADLQIKAAGTEAFLGAGILHPLGEGQIVTQAVRKDVSYHLRLVNTGNKPDSFLVMMDPENARWRVRLYDALTGGAEVSHGWTVADLAPGAARDFRLDVTYLASPESSLAHRTLVSVLPKGTKEVVDVVMALATRVSFQPDGVIQADGATQSVGEHLNNQTGEEQTVTQVVPAGAMAVYAVRVINAGNLADTFRLSAPPAPRGWTVRYTLDGGEDLTAALNADGLVLDNAAKTGVTLTGQWTVSTGVPGILGADHLHDGNTAKGLKSLRFTPALPAAGHYAVYLRWRSPHPTLASNVPVLITHAGGTTSVTVNQRAQGGKWVLLGTYSFPAGTRGWVGVKTAGTDGTVTMDAVQFTRVFPVASKAALALRLTVAADPTLPSAAACPLAVLATSVNDPRKRDCIRAQTRVAKRQPDLGIGIAGEKPLLAGEGVITPPTAPTVKSVAGEPAGSVKLQGVLRNVGDGPDAFRLRAVLAGTARTVTCTGREGELNALWAPPLEVAAREDGKALVASPDLPQAGHYAIALKWKSVARPATWVPVQITGLQAKPVTLTGHYQDDGWSLLGVVALPAGKGDRLRIPLEGVDGTVGITAVRFERVLALEANTGYPLAFTLTTGPGTAGGSLTLTAASVYEPARADAVRAVVAFAPPRPVRPLVQLTLDNADRGVSTTGIWRRAKAAGVVGADDLVSDPHAGVKSTVSFVPSLPVSGRYAIYLRWRAPHASLASVVPVEVTCASGVRRLTVNQRTVGGGWVKLGEFPVVASARTAVTVHVAGADGLVTADAVRFVELAEEVTLDDAERSGVTRTGSWTLSTSATGFVGSGYLHDANIGKGTKSITFTPALPSSGLYEVALRWRHADGQGASNVPVDLTFAGGTKTLLVDQRTANGVWKVLGVFPCAAGTAGSLRIRTTNTNGLVSVDAARWRRVGESGR